MRLIGWIVTVIGAVLVLGSFAAWVWLNAFACGMSPNGCNGWSLRWSDWEALSWFVPPFILGVIVAAVGLGLLRDSRKA